MRKGDRVTVSILKPGGGHLYEDATYCGEHCEICSEAGVAQTTRVGNPVIRFDNGDMVYGIHDYWGLSIVTSERIINGLKNANK